MEASAARARSHKGRPDGFEMGRIQGVSRGARRLKMLRRPDPYGSGRPQDDKASPPFFVALVFPRPPYLLGKGCDVPEPRPCYDCLCFYALAKPMAGDCHPLCGRRPPFDPLLCQSRNIGLSARACRSHLPASCRDHRRALLACSYLTASPDDPFPLRTDGGAALSAAWQE